MALLAVNHAAVLGGMISLEGGIVLFILLMINFSKDVKLCLTGVIEDELGWKWK